MNKDLKDQPASPSKSYEIKTVARVDPVMNRKALGPKESAS